LAVLDSLSGGVNALAFSTDDTCLAVGDSSGMVTLWDVATQRKRAGIHAHRRGVGGVVALAFSPGSGLLASAGSLDPTVRLGDGASGHPGGRLPGMALGVPALAFSPGGMLLALVGGGGTAAIWDVASRKELGTVRTGGPGLRSVAFSSEGRLLA